jgi:hypothetical protein
MEEANQFILLLQTELEREESEINVNIRKIFEKISKMKDAAKSNDEKYVKERTDLENELQRTVALKTFLGALKIRCSLLSFLGPKGQIAGSIIQTGIDIVTTFADAHSNKPISS